MPYATAGLHPLHTAGRQQTPCAVRVFVGGAAFEKIGEGRNARMGMQPETLEGSCSVIEKIEEDERLQNLPEVGWTHQTGYGSVVLAPGAFRNLTHRSGCDRVKRAHLGILRK